MARPVTLSDVAAAANVDLSTASRVLRGTGRASAATRQRIFDAAESLDFLPNAQAQFLAKGISKTVGVLTMNAPDIFSMPVLAGIGTEFGLRDVATLLYDARLDAAALKDSLRKLHARRIDGLMVLGSGLMDPIHSFSAEFDVPVVYAFGTSDSDRDAWFIPDGVMAGRMAAEHLIDIGRTRIAHITARKDIAARERIAGLLEVLGEHGLPLALGAPLEGNWLRRWGAEAATRILDSGEQVDAIFCGNDQIALGAYGVLRAAGVRVPDDIALVGIDNWEGMVGSGDNLLTTIDPNLIGVGRAAAEYLHVVTNEDYEAGVRHIPCALVLGETTIGSGARTLSDADGLV